VLDGQFVEEAKVAFEDAKEDWIDNYEAEGGESETSELAFAEYLIELAEAERKAVFKARVIEAFIKRGNNPADAEEFYEDV
jgi:hypothetical protein